MCPDMSIQFDNRTPASFFSGLFCVEIVYILTAATAFAMMELPFLHVLRRYPDLQRVISYILCTLILLLLTLMGPGWVPAADGATAAANEKSETITLRLWGGDWGIPAKDSTDPWRRAQRAVFERFQELHPNIRIVNSSGLQVQGPAAESGLLMAMAGGTAPDVFYVNFRKLHNYINQNFLYPLNEYVEKDPEVMQRIHPTIRKVVTVDGKVYSIPWYQCVMALYYRKDLYKAAGLNPNKPPQNWDEFYRYCQKLTIPEKGQYGFGFEASPSGTAFHWINFLWQAGGDIVEQDKDGQWKCMFNSPAGVKALLFFRKLVVDEWVRPSDGKHIKGVAAHSTTYATDIAQDKIAQWFSYTTDLATNRSNINPSLIGIAPLPAGPAGRANEINAGMWGMNSQIKDKRVRDAAWEYIKFMGSEEADRVRTKAYVESGLGKMVNPDKLEKYGYTEYLRGIPKSWIQANKEAFKHGRPEPHGKNCEMIYIELDYPLQEIKLHPHADPKKVLDAAAYKIDTKMLGYVDPQAMNKKRKIGWWVFALVLGLIGSVASVQVKKLAKSHTEEGADTRVVRGNRMIHVIAWLFMLPAVMSILVWAYYPLIRGMVMAFQDYRILGNSKFVGLDNFIEAFSSETFWRGVLNTLTYVGLNISLGFCVPIILAIMLNEVPRAKMFFRTIYYLPAVTSALVIIFLWKWFYDPSPQGLFNTLIGYYDQVATGLAQHIHPIFSHLQITQQTWLGDPKLAMLCIILPAIWAGAGPGSIIYLAAMKGIPDEMYEAADLDGAGIWSKIWKVTIPTLSPLIIINFVGAFIGSFKAMENIFIMTGGGPLNRTHTISLEIWYNAFMFLKFGYATAAAWIMGSMLIGFTMYQLRILRNVRFSTSGRDE
jgi:ABC-type sugar transport system permease subunit/ABC-type glycerol-3-phosphate transport system substrate-binding protein